MFEYAPSEVKLAFTGSGRAGEGPDAPHRPHAARRRRRGLSDEADALAIAVCHLARRAGRLPSPARVAARPAAAAAARPRGARRPRRAARLRPARRDHRRLAVIARLAGKVAEKGDDHAILDVGGVGYLVHLSAVSLARAPAAAASRPRSARSPTCAQDAIELFGFATEDEEAVFRALIDVKGVGPRAAQNILSGIEARELAQAVAQGDVARLTKVPGRREEDRRAARRRAEGEARASSPAPPARREARPGAGALEQLRHGAREPRLQAAPGGRRRRTRSATTPRGSGSTSCCARR